MTLADLFGHGPASEAAVVIRLVVALVLGGLLGAEREISAHPAGVRTVALVAAGACLFAAVGSLVVPHGDPTRIAAQVVTGIGFLGGGAILRQGGDVRGLTTAATIWFAAAVGVVVGFGSSSSAGRRPRSRCWRSPAKASPSGFHGAGAGGAGPTRSHSRPGLI